MRQFPAPTSLSLLALLRVFYVRVIAQADETQIDARRIALIEPRYSDTRDSLATSSFIRTLSGSTPSIAMFTTALGPPASPSFRL